ncbi:hypothetical protein F4780DRAFT_798544 [Xylariomycetidae sp. FL0641]|nr:hypothetical protein F4780DRAFT_798544 [Xylariomycetidae sp. FL0641]
MSTAKADETGKAGKICYRAYQYRYSDMMRWLKRGCAVGDQSGSRNEGADSAFAKAYHYLGRLADHVRAPRALLEDFADNEYLRNILEEFRVNAVEPVDRLRRASFERINLNGITKRMTPSHAPDLEGYQAALENMDRRFHLRSRIGQMYDDPNFRPQVYAEIQVLEHFHRNSLSYFQGIRYIGCWRTYAKTRVTRSDVRPRPARGTPIRRPASRTRPHSLSMGKRTEMAWNQIQHRIYVGVAGSSDSGPVEIDRSPAVGSTAPTSSLVRRPSSIYHREKDLEMSSDSDSETDGGVRL